ncbi:MAG: hypothetical protein JNM44_03710, partial [Chitinophagaceae bacterium]|nr:hypothetical protein [Chitinophagaceae bacterium]
MFSTAMVKNYSLFLMVFAGICTSCNLVNPKEPIPTYIQIDSVRLDPTLSS